MKLPLTNPYLILLLLVRVYGFIIEDSDQHVPLGGLKPGCEVKFEKVGCFKDNVSTRALPELIFDQRGDIIWKLDKWEDYLKQLACKCARRTDDRGYSHFGLQFYAECWTGLKAAERFDIYGKSKDCIGGRYLKCDDRDEGVCVGGGLLNYIYRVIPAGSGSGIGPLPD